MITGSPYHPGELAVQARAGVRDKAARVGNSIHGEIPPVAARFLEERSWVVIATAEEDGRPWVSLLAGRPGFVRVEDARTVTLAAAPRPGDPLERSVAVSRYAGLLGIDLATRRRMRLNGALRRADDGGLRIEASQVFTNCPRYIHQRPDPLPPGAGGRAPWRGSGLTDRQRDWIRGADTCFIGTLHPEYGADASHRGGPPGFIEVDGNRLIWPDYAGNMMYTTLGNIAEHPRAGLLVPDFATGALLLLSGRAGIVWEEAKVARVPGAERLVELEVDAVIELA
jgi:predicted pyridoxine 5'-phosphate oxidase superfamily flavin-nucleotide-binding protein